MKKKILAVALVLMMICSLTACGSKGRTVDSIKKAGKLVIATSPDFPPFESLEDGKVSGIEIDIMNLIAQKLGVELVIEQVDFDSVLPGVQAGKYDVGVSGITITEERAKNVLFTDAYCMAAQAIVVVEGSDVKAKADLTGKKISVQTGTTAEDYTMKNGYDVQAFSANSDAQTALTTGKVDAWVIDDLTAAEMVEAYNADAEKKLVILDEAMTTEPYAFAFIKGSEDLVKEINTIVNGLVEDGTVKSLFEKYEAPYTAPTK